MGYMEWIYEDDEGQSQSGQGSTNRVEAALVKACEPFLRRQSSIFTLASIHEEQKWHKLTDSDKYPN